MKAIFLWAAARTGASRMALGLGFAVVTLTLAQDAAAIPAVDLGTASGFAILAASQITDAGGVSTVVSGDVGLSPATGASIGLTAAQLLNGTIYSVDAFGPTPSVTDPGRLTQAQDDLTTAYNDAAGRPVDVDLGTIDNQLGGQTLFPGVYSFGHAATANLIGTLTLDANGDLDPVWIFQATSDLITASGSTVALINGATSCDVFWQVGSSATVGTYSDFAGTIMADQSIVLQSYATLQGATLARIAAITLDHNSITRAPCDTSKVPDAGSTLLLLGSGLASSVALGRRFLFLG